MKIALLAAAFTAAASASAGLAPSSINSVRDIPPAEPVFKLDLRLRDANGNVRADLLPPLVEGGGSLNLEAPHLRNTRPFTPRRWEPSDPKPITPQGDGEVYALHGKRGPQILPLAPMPIVEGVEIDPKMPMKTPDPTVDYKLHVLEMTPPASGDAKK
jgi:hypothetical protein